MRVLDNLFLVGPMGAGKSMVGRVLAQRLNRKFLDSDRELERRTGVDIPLIFELEGESGFRKREKALIDELTLRSSIVLATGGGAVLDPDNRTWLTTRGYTIYLRTSVDQQLVRTARDRKRPLLETADRRARLTKLIEVRGPLYQEIARLIVDTDGQSVHAVVSTVLAKLDWAANKAHPTSS